MTFSELLNLDKTSAHTTPLEQPGAPDKAHKDGESHQAATHHTVVESTEPPRQKRRPARHPATTKPRHPAPMTAATVRRLRQAVRRIGKEAATHRFTAQEKADLAQIIYEQGRQGVKTCENEIVRIAVNWLIAEHGARGEQSVLAQALKALRA